MDVIKTVVKEMQHALDVRGPNSAFFLSLTFSRGQRFDPHNRLSCALELEITQPH